MTHPAGPDCFAPIVWEPVQATGERLTVGAVVRFEGKVTAHRILRNDMLDCLYGKKAADVRNLIDTALEMIRIVCEHSVEGAQSPMGGFEIGPARYTEPKSVGDALRVCALMFSSLANINAIDDLAEEDTPAPEEAGRRFATEVRDRVLVLRRDLEPYFNRSATLIEGGVPVRFGFCSPSVVLHFGVLHPVRQAAGVRDARARLWELSRAREFAQIPLAALIVGSPREDDPTLSGKQVDALRRNLREIEREADENRMRFLSVNSVESAAEKVIEFARA
ncbi:MAG: hypothetical protein HGA47_00075 [Zoogloea sp.]|nr:hypothetical protein [Zoogloea sp.]